MRIVVTNPGTLKANWVLESETVTIDVPDDADVEGIDLTVRTMYDDKRRMGHSAGLGTFDTAIPLSFTDSVYENTGRDTFGFVWAYDEHEIFGHPVPLTKEAYITLREYEKVRKVR